MGRCHHSQPHLLFPCRVGWPEDSAEPVSFLCSPEAGSITSKNIMVAGFSPQPLRDMSSELRLAS